MICSELIELLQIAKALYGDMPVRLLDPDTGDWHNVKQVLKLHPYNGEYGCMNRKEKVNAFAVMETDNNAPDLIITKT